ncbi:uncharacterized protein [Epargyreus clarus]|uniref:uncharacterized protein isoform X2 n=1 Tax=Epargyreus clarus TaxID=520877 RepID=UPI003C307BF3
MASCSISMPSTPSTTTMMEEILTTAKPTTKTSLQTTIKTEPTTRTTVTETTVPSTTPMQTTSSTTTSPPPTTTSSTVRTTTTTQTTTTTPTSTTVVTRSTTVPTELFDNFTATPAWTTQSDDMLKAPKNIAISSNYNRTEIPIETSTIVVPTNVSGLMKEVTVATTSTILPPTTTVETTSLVKLTVKETATKTESSKKPDTTAKLTTIKTKPKEIWIRPTQRGESTFIETKIKPILEQHNRYRSATKNEEVSELTTPRTIIVSIIPTSVSYVTFKKIALTTASYVAPKNNVSLQQQQPMYNKSEQAITKSLSTQPTSTSMPTIRISTLVPKNVTTSTVSLPHKNITKSFSKFEETHPNTMKVSLTSKTTNSMPSTLNAANKNSSNILTNTSSSTNNRITQGLETHGTTLKFSKNTSINRLTTPGPSTMNATTSISHITTTSVRSKLPLPATNVIKYHQSEKPRNVTLKPVPTTKPNEISTKTTKLLAIHHSQKVNDTKKNITKISNTKSVTTAEPLEDETFHILTEPEHITAVMSDKGRDHSTVDLISVISIAGGVMMAVITVAVIIVMVERCKRPRYEDVRKINDIRMQVMIDNNDVPPPYVRSIFHTPLPEPPSSEKCHYQPISTLDRNLKQFMRPVVVQTISPIMLENFRGILECHYDHLPQRNYDCGTMSTRCSVTPSMACTEELCGERALSVSDYTIEALKCEAKLDVIDNTTSEPLYAEIPCWRPPSEHAIEVLNLNGEAITEL